MPTQTATRDPVVFVVDDDAALRQSLCFLIESVDVKVQAFESAQQFLDNYDPDTPGCLVLDVRMPGMSGLELQQRLREQRVTIPVIVITGHGDIAMAVKAMKAGAVEFIEKPVGDQQLLDCIQQAISKDVNQRNNRDSLSDLRTRRENLTPREVEVMNRVVDGYSSREIGDALGVSFKTVEAHRAKVMRKMRAESVPQLVRMVLMLEE